MATDNRVLEWALYYIKQGWAVLPLHTIKDGKCTCPKPNECKPGKHPYGPLAPNGSKDATTDKETIHKWFGGDHDVNIGVCAGRISGLVLLDIDPDHGGNESLKNYPEIPRTVTVATGGGGSHYYLKHPGNVDIANSAGTLGPGLDVRGHHGYVVAPPSRHVSGKEYRWKVDPRSPGIEIAPCPEWVYKHNGQKRNTQKAGPGKPIKKGARDSTLTSIGGRLRHGGMQFHAIRGELQKVNEDRCRPMLSDGAVEKIARSVCKYEPGMIFDLNDAGNAERVAREHGDKLRYCWNVGKWLAFDNTRWSYDRGIVEATNCAIKSARQVIVEAANCDDENQRKQLFKWSCQSQKASNVTAMLSLARVLPPIVAYAEDFDQDKLLLNVLDGTIDLRTGQLKAHDPDNMITQLAPVNYSADQKQPSIDLWMECLNTWHRGAQDAIDYLQRLAGMCLTGDTSSRCFPIFYGGGKNGKSVFLDTLMMILGDYATIAPRTLLKVSRNEEHATELAGLLGKRFVIASETRKGMRLKTSLVKAMTGDQRLTARFMRQDYFEFQPTHKTILVTQNLPVIDEASDAIWDRVHKMEWGVRIPDDQQNTHLIDDLKAEWPGILRWAIEGCLQWQKDGILVPTESIRRQTQEYRNDQNPLKAFIEDECILGPELKVGATELKGVFDTWARINGYDDKVSAREFSELMRAIGFTKGTPRIHGKTTKCWLGIGLSYDGDENEK